MAKGFFIGVDCEVGQYLSMVRSAVLVSIVDTRLKGCMQDMVVGFIPSTCVDRFLHPARALSHAEVLLCLTYVLHISEF